MGESVEPKKSPWARVVGPCYTEESMFRLSGVATPELNDLFKDGKLFFINTAEGESLFPDFQFHNGHQIEGFAAVVDRFLNEAKYDRYMAASALRVPKESFGEMSLVEALIVASVQGEDGHTLSEFIAEEVDRSVSRARHETFS